MAFLVLWFLIVIFFVIISMGKSRSNGRNVRKTYQPQAYQSSKQTYQPETYQPQTYQSPNQTYQSQEYPSPNQIYQQQAMQMNTVYRRQKIQRNMETQHASNTKQPPQKQNVRQPFNRQRGQMKPDNPERAKDHNSQCGAEDGEYLLGSVYDLMVKGYDGNLNFERDFIGEAMDMIHTYTL